MSDSNFDRQWRYVKDLERIQDECKKYIVILRFIDGRRLCFSCDSRQAGYYIVKQAEFDDNVVRIDFSFALGIYEGDEEF